ILPQSRGADEEVLGGATIFTPDVGHDPLIVDAGCEDCGFGNECDAVEYITNAHGDGAVVGQEFINAHYGVRVPSENIITVVVDGYQIEILPISGTDTGQ